ncbi:gastric triacylglycerol lipase-like [Dysidea avara]|uniref:gastric triacylglycerol lipase-like n=1 Tax=Dysidea avara TaxID=196820 RepID=UPI003323C4D0
MHIILCSCLLVEVKERFGEENITTMIVTVVVLLLVVTSNVHAINTEVDPDLNRDTVELITSKGYPAETHQVTTQDGYILTIHRIPHGDNSSLGAVQKPVVFLQHGLVCSSAEWVINLANQSLGFILADAGFDVWMGNVRGNTYSRNHTRLSPSDKEFWDFSFDEHAKYDLPAMLNYVLQETAQEKLVYVGYSQGTMMGFAGFSTQPELADKVKLFIALAPVARMSNLQGALRPLSKFVYNEVFIRFFNLIGGTEFLPSNEFTNFIASQVCPKPVIDEVCRNILFLITGFDDKQLNKTRLPVYLSHLPAGTSEKNIVHFARQVYTEKFHRYDYLKAGNLLHYGRVHYSINCFVSHLYSPQFHRLLA